MTGGYLFVCQASSSPCGSMEQIISISISISIRQSSRKWVAAFEGHNLYSTDKKLHLGHGAQSSSRKGILHTSQRLWQAVANSQILFIIFFQEKSIWYG